MKSHASDFLSLFTTLYTDVCERNALQLDVRDLDTLRSRVEDEGLSFLTITLPTLCADLEKALSVGAIVPGQFRSFKKRLKIPCLFQGVFELVFDKTTGRCLNEPSITAIASLRQLANLCKKVKINCSRGRLRAAVDAFRTNERIFNDPISENDTNDFVSVSRIIWSSVLSGQFNDLEGLVPKHGPGSTAESRTGNAKYRLKRWHDRLEHYFPMLANAYSSESAYGSREFESVEVVPGELEQPVRVVFVPKTLKTPRVIAIEPVCMQYVQQALAGQLVKEIEDSKLTGGHINFSDQTINQDLVVTSSVDCSYATIDMSAASDRVPVSLAMRMFDTHPDLQGAIFSCRSRRAELPDGDIITLGKFASMGSALCFPVEAMYFYTICIVALLKKRKLPATYQNIYKMGRRVFVYGDDILVPTDTAEVVMETLHKYYCKVNTAKSFWNGSFRESCGVDAYQGVVITPTYLRSVRPCDKRDGSSIISWVETANQLYRKGYWKTASAMKSIVEGLIGTLPVKHESDEGLGWISYQLMNKSKDEFYVDEVDDAQKVTRVQTRYNKHLMRFEVKTWVPSVGYRKDVLNGYAALSKCLIKQAYVQTSSLSYLDVAPCDTKHLDRSVRRGAVSLKRRWVPAFG